MPIVFAGMVLFFLMPHFTDSPWIPSKLTAAGEYKVKTGGGGPGIEMFREGIVQLSHEPAFEVDVCDKDGQPAALPETQRWRTQILDIYRRGRGEWHPHDLAFLADKKVPLPDEDHRHRNTTIHSGPPDDMDGNQVYLLFHVDQRKVSGIPLADPIAANDSVALYPCIKETPLQIPLIHLESDCDTYVRNHEVFAKNPAWCNTARPSCLLFTSRPCLPRMSANATALHSESKATCGPRTSNT